MTTNIGWDDIHQKESTTMLMPLGNHLTITLGSVQDATPTATASGIALPQAEKARCKWATVEQVGADIKGIHPGDVILYNGFGGVEVLDGTNRLLLLTDKDIFGVLQ